MGHTRGGVAADRHCAVDFAETASGAPDRADGAGSLVSGDDASTPDPDSGVVEDPRLPALAAEAAAERLRNGELPGPAEQHGLADAIAALRIVRQAERR